MLTFRSGQVPAQPPSQDKSMAEAFASPHPQVSGVPPQLGQWENNSSLDIDFLGSGFLDEWQQIGQLDFPE